MLPEGNETEGYRTGKAYLVDGNGNYVLGFDGNRITGGSVKVTGLSMIKFK